jgi:hypothetical protein
VAAGSCEASEAGFNEVSELEAGLKDVEVELSAQ